jgi:hypothetical protein
MKRYEKVEPNPFMESLGITEPFEVDMDSIREEAAESLRLGPRVSLWPKEGEEILVTIDGETKRATVGKTIRIK